MAKRTKVGVTSKPAETAAGRDACLVQIYPSGPEMGTRYPLAEVSLIMGRDPGCDISINNEFISRHHARIQPGAASHQVVDLHSTNGTYVNEVRVSDQTLQNGDYLQIGNCIFRFLAGGNVEAQYHEEIHRLTIIDALTGIHNHRSFLEHLEHEMSRSARFGMPLALIMLDLDWFKTVNDELGHLGGDFTLRELANCIRPLVRSEDIFARYGGEEFAVVMPETVLEKAVETAEQLRGAVEQHAFSYEDKTYQVTISLGVSVTAPRATADQAHSSTELVRQADEKMYRAKQNGRNRVVG